jgi:hypothetical protein
LGALEEGAKLAYSGDSPIDGGRFPPMMYLEIIGIVS